MPRPSVIGVDQGVRVHLPSSVVDLLLRLLAAPSVTPDDAGLMALAEAYLHDFEAIRYDRNGVKNLFLTRKFGEGTHLCFAGHVDVVPPGEGWNSPPFVPKIEAGYIYARGAQDMKSGVAASLAALKEIDTFSGRLSLLLTSDEEGEATDGTQIMLEHLRSLDLLPEYCVVAEPTCETTFGDAIKIGRRGSINGYLRIRGRQGHAAYPEKAINPVHQIAPVLTQLAGVDLDEGDADFAPSKMVITDIRGGMQVTNVTPDELTIMFNVRNNTRTTADDVRAHIERVCHGLEWDLTLTQGSFPFVTRRDSPLVERISDSIASVTGHRPALSTAGGTSDARFMGAYGIDVVEFGPRNDTIHAANERVAIDEVEGLYRVFGDLIKRMG
jgi:succinyl-diaminopimelate desuccinylase